MDNTTIQMVMQAATPATDLALEGKREQAIAILVAAGATAEFAGVFLDGYVAHIAAGIAAQRKAERDAETAERIAYNVRTLISEGWSPEAARARAEAWS